MATTLLEKADPEFAKLRQKRRDLAGEAERLKGKLRQKQGKQAPTDDQYAVAHKVRDVQQQRQALDAPYRLARGRAGQAATQEMIADRSYQKQVRSAVLGLDTFLSAWAPLVAAIKEAQQEGLALPSPPPAMVDLPRIARLWLEQQISLGTLSMEDLPAGVRELVGGSNGT